MLLFYDFFYGCELSLFEKFFCFLRSYLSADNEWYNQAFDYNNPPASMLFERIVLRPSDFEISLSPKGVRENTFYTVRMQTITERTSNPIILKRTITYNMTLRGKVERNGRQYNVVNVDAVDVYTVERYYRQNKSIVSLKRLIVEMRNYNAGRYFDHFALIYSRDASINEDVEILPHVNSKYTSAKSYIRTSNKILEVEDQLLSSGHSIAEIYDKVLQESGGPHISQSQLSEPRDKSQIYRQKNKK